MIYVLTIICIFVFVLIIHVSTKNNTPLFSEGLQYFCIKDSGYYVTVWPKNQKAGEYLEFDIAGISYQKNIDKYLGEFVGTLEPDPTNPYDHNAIKILAPDDHHVGYVPRNMTIRIKQSRTLPCKCYCYIGRRKENNGIKYYSDCYIKI